MNIRQVNSFIDALYAFFKKHFKLYMKGEEMDPDQINWEEIYKQATQKKKKTNQF